MSKQIVKLSKEQKANAIPNSDVTKIDDRYWKVKSQSRDMYMYVDIEERSCSCEDHQRTGKSCKHILKVDNVRKEMIQDVITEVMLKAISKIGVVVL